MLKLVTIVEQARLNPFSAQHVLRYAAKELRFPRSPGQGKRRSFSLRQATRLAIACKLINTSTVVDEAVRVVLYAEQRVARVMNLDPDAPGRLYPKQGHEPWVLEVFDGLYAQARNQEIWRRRPPLDWGSMLEVRTGRTVYEEALEPWIAVFRVYLSDLEARLASWLEE